MSEEVKAFLLGVWLEIFLGGVLAGILISIIG